MMIAAGAHLMLTVSRHHVNADSNLKISISPCGDATDLCFCFMLIFGTIHICMLIRPKSANLLFGTVLVLIIGRSKKTLR